MGKKLSKLWGLLFAIPLAGCAQDGHIISRSEDESPGVVASESAAPEGDHSEVDDIRHLISLISSLNDSYWIEDEILESIQRIPSEEFYSNLHFLDDHADTVWEGQIVVEPNRDL
jgi:hypothetical protein